MIVLFLYSQKSYRNKATNKNAVIRYQALDKCFSNFYKHFFICDLIKACNDSLFEFSGIVEGVKRRQIFDDIRFMESKEGYSIPLERIKDGKRCYYRYSDKNYSINKQPLTSSEASNLHESLMILNRFKGLPQEEWLDDLINKLEVTYKLNGMKDGIVSFDHNPYLKGLSFFSELFHAIINSQALDIWYSAAFGPSEQYEIHPYFLKQYNTRWFLFGARRCDNGYKVINMALDRIDSISQSSALYKENNEIDFEEYFDNVFGVTVPDNCSTEDILLQIDKDRYNYVASKPMHHSQTIIAKNENSVTIRLHLISNYEFETMLLGFADSIEILKPAWLRSKILERAKTIAQKNK